MTYTRYVLFDSECSFVANQSVAFVSVTSPRESANTRFTLTHAEEQFKIITRLPHQPVQCSSATATANQPFTVRNSARMIQHIQTSHQQNQSVQPQDTPQNLHHPSEILNLQQSVKPPLIVMQETDSQITPKESEQPHSEALVHQLVHQQDEHTPTQNHQHASE